MINVLIDKAWLGKENYIIFENKALEIFSKW